MDSLKYKIYYDGRKYEIYIHRGMHYFFNTKNEARIYVRNHKKAAYHNVLMLDNLYEQLSNLVYYVYPRLNLTYKFEIQEIQKEYISQKSQIYSNRGGENFTTVQFNKIFVCFSIVSDMIRLLKTWGNRNKDITAKLRLTTVENLHFLVEETFIRDHRNLMDFHQRKFSGRLIKMNENENIAHKSYGKAK